MKELDDTGSCFARHDGRLTPGCRTHDRGLDGARESGGLRAEECFACRKLVTARFIGIPLATAG